jgi:hypothetical protein
MRTGLGIFCAMLIAAGMLACTSSQNGTTFQNDVDFMANHLDVIVLSDNSQQAQIAVVPAYQGRVMTSTAGGPDGLSFGWINRELIASGEFQDHMNAFGGEDRFWMGPEGGQFSIFFKKGAEFNLEHWQTPPVIDTVPYAVADQSDTSITFQHKANFANMSDTEFDVLIDRTIRLLDTPTAMKNLGVPVPASVNMVGYESENKLTNNGRYLWTKETGLLSIWILGMYNPSPKTTIVIPFTPGPESELGPKVNDAYFGKVPADRLVVEDDILFFSGDGNYRSKIGLTPQRAKPVLGSYDGANQVLTIVQYTKPDGETSYVNSMWEMQDQPFSGDAINSYNDGPPEPGKKPLGPFYELETSSPAALLQPGESITHIHRTFHLQGSEEELNPIAQAVLGADLNKIKSVFAQ